MSPGTARLFALVTAAALLAFSPVSSATSLPSSLSPSFSDVEGLDLSHGLRLLPTAQLDQATGFLPKGQLADDPVDWPIAVGQFFASAAINVGGLFLFQTLATPGADWSSNAVKGQLITTGVIQFLTLPLLSATGVYLVGQADELHDVGFGWPLLANYVAELALVAVKIGIDLGAVQGTDVAQKAADLLSGYVAIDYVLHAIVPPVLTTYMSIRSRDPKGISFARLDRYVPDTQSLADVRIKTALAATEPPVAAFPVAVGRF